MEPRVGSETRAITNFLDIGVRDEVDAKVVRFFVDVVYHLIFFTPPIGIKLLRPSTLLLKDTRALGIRKLELSYWERKK